MVWDHLINSKSSPSTHHHKPTTTIRPQILPNNCTKTWFAFNWWNWKFLEYQISMYENWEDKKGIMNAWWSVFRRVTEASRHHLIGYLNCKRKSHPENPSNHRIISTRMHLNATPSSTLSITVMQLYFFQQFSLSWHLSSCSSLILHWLLAIIPFPIQMVSQYVEIHAPWPGWEMKQAEQLYSGGMVPYQLSVDEQYSIIFLWSLKLKLLPKRLILSNLIYILIISNSHDFCQSINMEINSYQY